MNFLSHVCLVYLPGLPACFDTGLPVNSPALHGIFKIKAPSGKPSPEPLMALLTAWTRLGYSAANCSSRSTCSSGLRHQSCQSSGPASMLVLFIAHRATQVCQSRMLNPRQVPLAWAEPAASVYCFTSIPGGQRDLSGSSSPNSFLSGR